jgi:hypothetical protein
MLWKVALSILIFVAPVMARDDGRYVGAPLHEWFDGLSSGYGRCCSDADGTAVVDADWEGHDGHYRVRIDGDWCGVPDRAVMSVGGRISNLESSSAASCPVA